MENVLWFFGLHADGTAWLRETLLRGVRAAWTISDFSERTRLQLLFCRSTWLSNLAPRMSLFVSVVCLAFGTVEKNKMSWLRLNSFIHAPLGPLLIHLSPTAVSPLDYTESSFAARIKVAWEIHYFFLWIYNVLWDLFYFHQNMSIMSLDLILCLVVTLQAEEVEQLLWMQHIRGFVTDVFVFSCSFQVC